MEESAIAKPIVAVFEEKRGVGIFALYRDSIQLNLYRMFNRVFNRVHYTLYG